MTTHYKKKQLNTTHIFIPSLDFAINKSVEFSKYVCRNWLNEKYEIAGFDPNFKNREDCWGKTEQKPEGLKRMNIL